MESLDGWIWVTMLVPSLIACFVYDHTHQRWQREHTMDNLKADVSAGLAVFLSVITTAVYYGIYVAG